MANSMQSAKEHLKKHDPVLAYLITAYGSPAFKPHNRYYQELVESIISQQLSVKAAATITKRLIDDLFKGSFPTPQQILATPHEALRCVGLSNAKANYVRDLAQHVVNGTLQVEELPELSNDEVIKELTAVKGIGEWTAHMFLIFSLGRLDVLPTGDLGLRAGIQKLYRLKSLPTPAGIAALATKKHWAPYQSVASWYVWQSLNNK